MGNPTIDPTKKARRSNQEPLRQEREKMQKPPQIIVIPQSMLAGQKSLLRLAPSPAPLLGRHLPNALVQPSACGSGGWQQETSPNCVSSAKGTPAGHQGGKHRERGPGQEESQLGPPQPRGTDDEEEAEEQSRRP